jgi:hypothetical protein
MERNLNWAVLGTGVIANEMAQALKSIAYRHPVFKKTSGTAGISLLNFLSMHFYK